MHLSSDLVYDLLDGMAKGDGLRKGMKVRKHETEQRELHEEKNLLFTL